MLGVEETRPVRYTPPLPTPKIQPIRYVPRDRSDESCQQHWCVKIPPPRLPSC